MDTRHCCLGLLLAAAVVAGCEPLEEGKPAEKAAKSAKPAARTDTCKVERGPIKVQANLKGVFEASDVKELALRPKAWTPERQGILVVGHAVEHGSAVKKGEVVVRFDLEKINQAIRDLKAERGLAEGTIRQAEAELPLLEKSAPLELAQAERNKKEADEDLKRFVEVDRPMAIDSAEHALAGANHWLEAAREELRQLQKMYRDKDLTEDTEEFILKRQRHAVYMAEFYVKMTRADNDRTLHIELPRQEQTARTRVATQAVALDRTHDEALTLQQKRLALEKLKYDDARTAERLKNLEEDRRHMVVRAPMDGIVYHGRCNQGQWTIDLNKLRRGGNIMPEEVFMTIVAVRPMFVRATVEEKDLHLLRPDQSGRVVPAGFPDLVLSGRVKAVGPVPHSSGSFHARVEVEPGDGGRALVPGMACTMKVVGYQKDNALLVPATAVFAEDGDDDAHYVYLATGTSGHEKRSVKVGKTSGSKTEIVDGLHEGDQILKSKP